LDAVVTGAKGSALLEPLYEALSVRAFGTTGGKLRPNTYKERCGEFHAASAFGFSTAVGISAGRFQRCFDLHPRFARRQSLMRGPPLSRFHAALIITGCLCVAAWALRSYVVLVACSFVIFSVVVGLGVTFPQMKFFGPFLCRGKGDLRRVALTFD